MDSHITELVAERNKERHVSIHAKPTAYDTNVNGHFHTFKTTQD